MLTKHPCDPQPLVFDLDDPSGDESSTNQHVLTIALVLSLLLLIVILLAWYFLR